jgi:beta-aspartyl-peptidase (threonine type)
VAKRITIAVHGGAGVMAHLTRAQQAMHRQGLERALDAGYQVLARGGASLDAVSAAVVALEDDPLFNAGRGAVYNAAGKHELDASIMDGATLRAGAVAAVSRIRNPVLAARAVMEKSPHVLLVGRGAEQFARQHGLPLVRNTYFNTQERREALRKGSQRHHGTVGAVALDRQGNLAAATSTGGYTGKLPGRVGDSPLIGAGTYADNSSRAVSGTGWARPSFASRSPRGFRPYAPEGDVTPGGPFCLTKILVYQGRRRADRARPPGQHRHAIQQRRNAARLHACRRTPGR